MQDLEIKYPDQVKQILSDPNSKDYARKVFCNKKECSKKYKIVFLQEATPFIKDLIDAYWKLLWLVGKCFIIYFCAILLPFFALMTYFLQMQTKAFTRPVIELYELICEFIDDKRKRHKLRYKPTNNELNALHKSFN